MTIDKKTIDAVRERVGVGIADARRALAACDADIDKAAQLLRGEGIEELRRRTGADGALCARMFDEVAGDLERATLRLKYLTRPEPPSPAIAILDSGDDDESAARDLHDCLGNAERGPVTEEIYLVMDLWTRIEADGLSEYLTTASKDEWDATLNALRTMGSVQVAEMFADAIRTASEPGALDALGDGFFAALSALDKQFYDRAEDLARLVMEFARRHRAELSSV